MKKPHNGFRMTMAIALSCVMALGSTPAMAFAEAVDVDDESIQQVEVADVGEGIVTDEGDGAILPEEATAEESSVVEYDLIEEESAATESEGVEGGAEAAVEVPDGGLAVQEGEIDLGGFFSGVFFNFDGKRLDANDYGYYYVEEGGSVTPNIHLEKRGYDANDDEVWTPLQEGRDYTLSFEDYGGSSETAPFGEGLHYVIATAVAGSGYTGSTDMSFVVTTRHDLLMGADVDSSALEPYQNNDTGEYEVPTGTKPSFSVVYKDGQQVPSSAYEVEYYTYDDYEYVGSTFPTALGHYYMQATCKGAYHGDPISSSFYVVKALGNSTIKVADQTKTYTGQALAYSGSVTKTGSTGKVTYSYYSDSACTKSVAAANVKNAGTYYVKATLAADANFKAATSAAAKLTIAKASSSIKLAAQTKTYSGKAIAYSGTVTKSGSASVVSYTYYSDAACTKVVAAANVKAAGTYYVKAKLAADANHNAATSAAAKLTIAKAASSIKLAAQTKTYNGKALAYSGKVTKSGSAGKVTYAYFSDAKCTKSVKAANVKGAGTYYVKATLAADANHSAATSAVAKLTVAKAANPITAKAANKTAKLASVKTKAVVVACPMAVAKAQGKLTYAKVVNGSSAALTVNKTTGKVTVKKGTKKGTYTIKVKVTAAGNANYKAGSKTITCKVVVK